jgi:hypothetical protein
VETLQQLNHKILEQSMVVLRLISTKHSKINLPQERVKQMKIMRLLSSIKLQRIRRKIRRTRIGNELLIISCCVKNDYDENKIATQDFQQYMCKAI